MYWGDSDIPFDSTETAALIRRYENMLKHNRNDYFNEEEFEIIIDHYLISGKSVEALLAADCGSRQHPFSTDMKLRYAHALVQKGEARKALRMLQEMEATIINDPELFFISGTAHLLLKNKEEALSYFDKCIRQAEPEDCVSFLMNIATNLVDKHEYAFALPYIRRAFDIDPEDLDIINEMAFCHERLNNLNESVLYYEAYIREEPFNDNVWYNLGTVYARAGNYKQAVQAFHFAITINDDNSSAYFNLANTLIREEEYAEAITILQDFLKLEPSCVAGHVAIAECYDQLGNNEQAIVSYLAAIGYDGYCPEAHYGLAIVYTQTKQLEEALTHAYKATRLLPDCAEYGFLLGTVLLQLGKKELAEQAMEWVVNKDSHMVDAWVILADLKAEKGFLKEAIQLLLQAYLYNDKTPDLLYRLCTLYYKAGDTKECLQYLEPALSAYFDEAAYFFDRCPDAMEQPEIKQRYDTYKLQNKNEQNV